MPAFHAPISQKEVKFHPEAIVIDARDLDALAEVMADVSALEDGLAEAVKVIPPTYLTHQFVYSRPRVEERRIPSPPRCLEGFNFV